MPTDLVSSIELPALIHRLLFQTLLRYYLGTGVGWYSINYPHKPPGLFKGTEPAWSNANLREISNITASKCIMAHVRAASPGMAVALPNVHPFKAGRLLFCHNGAIQQFHLIRRKLLNQVTDEVYRNVQGTTDSEVCFALLLTNLSKDGMAPEGVSNPYEQMEPYGHDRLYNALKRTIRQVEHVLKETGIQNMTETPSRMNFALTDGETVICSRFTDKYPDVAPPSLYFAYGDAEQLQRELCDEDGILSDDNDAASSDNNTPSDDSTDYDSVMSMRSKEHFDAVEKDLSQQHSLPGKLLSDVDPKSSAFIVSSDPLTKTSSQISWHRVAANSIICYTRGGMPRLYHLNVGGAKRPEDYAFFLVNI